MISSIDRRLFLGAGAALLAPPAAAQAAARITTLVGTGMAGMVEDGATLASAAINNPFGVIVGPDGALYWADFASNRVLKLDSARGRVFVVAGTGQKGHAGDGGPARQALMSAPHEVRFDRAGNMLVAERDAHVVRHIDMKSGIITTLAGTGEAGFAGDGGLAEKALLHQPHSIALDKDDNLYICDILNNRVRRRESSSGIITTFAGTGETTPTPEAAPLAGTALWAPRSIDIGPDGTLFLILREGNKAFSIDPVAKSLKHLAGAGPMGYGGDGGPALAALFRGPKGVCLAPGGDLYIADTENHVIRKLVLQGGTIWTVAGTGKKGDGPDGEPLGCALNRPHGVFAHQNRLYIGDAENNKIRALNI